MEEVIHLSKSDHPAIQFSKEGTILCHFRGGQEYFLKNILLIALNNHSALYQAIESIQLH